MLRGIGGAIKASSFGGEVSIERATGRLEASGVNRGVTITDATGAIVADSTSGGIRQNGVRSLRVEVSALSGGITFDGDIAPDGVYRLSSHSGAITITAPALDATITFRSFSGRLENAFDAKAAEAARRGQTVTQIVGAGRARIDLDTFSGSIRIRRR